MRQIVNPAEWESAIEAFRVKEKEQTRRQDKLNAERRRLPMVEIEKTYEFTGPDGRVSLLDLFEGRRQLILYHFMYAESPCTGCSMVVDNIGHIAHIQARNTSFVMVSRAPYPKLVAFKQRMGWDIPWYSSHDSDFNIDFNATRENGEMFAVSVFLREGEKIYRTYYTTLRGVEYLGSIWSYLDLTPMGRQELWEDSPEDVIQTPPYQWMRLHDGYN
ncbi:DUF899 domain-containing protein [Hahella sp. CCB-MM4]|uniref:DUF899 domain-containing protein n=1 Tax=Hahella sp. (strain CCB-MM4) TaxID=1926491 RepID=UPI000B9BD87B|nr:DUF899 domain-containing protein [Hahella sp. CCB-MM4]